MSVDPAQLENVVEKATMKPVAATLRKWIPIDFAKLAEGSKHRILERRANGWYWEGELIKQE